MMAFDRLEAGKASYALALQVYDITEDFPKREWFGLAAQARRAAISVPLNLAEGSAKRGPREFRRYVDIAMGSLAELVIALRLSRDRKFLSAEQWASFETCKENASKMVWSLARSLDRQMGRSNDK
jgi:four helix bundle protein